MSKSIRASSRLKGFSLIELLIVVAVLGILAAIALPTFSNVQEKAKINAAATEMRTLVNTAERYRLDHDGWPPDYWIGVMPTEFEQYLPAFDYARETAVGGNWEFDNWIAGPAPSAGGQRVSVATGLVDADSVAYVQGIDAILDDGDLASGRFQQFVHAPQFFVVGYVHLFEGE